MLTPNNTNIAKGAILLSTASFLAQPSLASDKTSSNKPSDRPNIVFFLVDDMGCMDSEVAYLDSVCALNKRYHTPNMKRLAEKGVTFTNAYACPVSSPTRTSLMTGMHAAHLKITNYTTANPGKISDAESNMQALQHGELSSATWNFHGISPTPGVKLTTHITPMVQLLKDAGYYTIHVGKGHWAAAGTPGASPYNLGFCVNVAGQVAGRPDSYYGEENYGNTKEKWSPFSTMNLVEYYGTHTHLTEALTLEALKTLDYPIRNKIPFYLYMAHHGVHTPVTPDDRFVDKYLKEGCDKGQANYASMIEGVDKSLGDIMQYLEDRDVAKNTIIIFYSDNGGNCENLQKGGKLHTQNLPLREGKASVYEGGVHVPMMAYWPGVGQTGKRVNTPVSCEDFFPSILNMAGVKNYNTIQQIDGVDFTPLITGKGKAPDNDREIISHFPHQWKLWSMPNFDYMTAMRKGNWKIVYDHLSQRIELYDLSKDISEKNDVASKYPDKAKELAKILSDKLRAWDAPMPHIRATGKLVPLPDEI